MKTNEKCGIKISDTALTCGSSATLLSLPHIDVICGLLLITVLNRRMATWNHWLNISSRGYIRKVWRLREKRTGCSINT